MLVLTDQYNLGITMTKNKSLNHKYFLVKEAFERCTKALYGNRKILSKIAMFFKKMHSDICCFQIEFKNKNTITFLIASFVILHLKFLSSIILKLSLILKFFSGTLRISIDVGGVIVKMGDLNDEPIKKNDIIQNDYLDSSLFFIKMLVKILGSDNVIILSKAGNKHSTIILQSFIDDNFFEKTNVELKNVFFCKEKNHKSTIIEMFDISIHFDDRFSVIQHINKTVLCVLFPIDDGNDKLPISFNGLNIIKVNKWMDLLFISINQILLLILFIVFIKNTL